MTDAPRVLVLCDVIDRLRPIIEGAFPDLDIRYCDETEAVPGLLTEFAPEVVLGVPGEPFPKGRFPEILNTESVQWLSNAGAGVEHLGVWDTDAKTVTNAAGVNARYLAEYTIAAHMSANIRFPLYAQQQREKLWRRHEWVPFQGRRFCVVGLGNIGRAVAERAKALDLHVVGTRGTARPTDHVDEVFGPDGLHQALTGAEFVSVHTASTAETKDLISDPEFDLVADGAIFLNAARGPVVDEEALLRALDRGKVGTAILDVFRTEPLPTDSPLWAHERVIVTPHMADSIAGWQENNARFFCENLTRWIAGEPLRNVVDPGRGY